MDSSFNTITIENSNLNNQNYISNVISSSGQEVLNVHKKSSKSVSMILDEEKEQTRKDSSENNDTIKVAQNITFTKDDSHQSQGK